MEYFPSVRNFKRTIVYGITVALVGLIITSATVSPLSTPAIIANLLILVGLATYLAASYRALKRFGYDAKGVYRWGKVMFQWQQVKRITLSFKKSSGSFPLLPKPTWASLAGGLPIIEHETWVSYGAGMVFVLEDGKAVEIKSNLNDLSERRVIDRVDELAKAANPRIEFE